MLSRTAISSSHRIMFAIVRPATDPQIAAANIFGLSATVETARCHRLDYLQLRMNFVATGIGALCQCRIVENRLTCDVMLELFNDEVLITDDVFDQVAYRNDPNQLFLVEDREMPYGFFGHDSHTFFD